MELIHKLYVAIEIVVLRRRANDLLVINYIQLMKVGKPCRRFEHFERNARYYTLAFKNLPRGFIPPSFINLRLTIKEVSL